MKLAATIDYRGSVTAIARDADIPRDGISFRADGENPKTLYVNGIEVGELMAWPTVDGEFIHTYGNPTPDSFFVSAMELRAWIELPHMGDVP